jgi:serine/threonine protein kinase
MEKIEYPILDKKYKLLSKLGSGATSEVYLGENLETKEKIAIKILKLDTKPFEQETETLSLLHHKNILNLISKCEGAIEKEQNKSPNYKYIILEYAEKGELFNYVYFPQ